MKKDTIGLVKTNKNGFSLVEILIVMSILVFLTLGLIVILNPILLVNKAGDSNRKSDLNKLRTAFEEYLNDKRNYPSYEKLNEWNTVSNCGQEISEIKSYINKWPCDSTGVPYIILVGDDWFKVITNLMNKKDNDLPDNWYTDDGTLYPTLLDKNEANYGVSSSNVLWYEGDTPSSSCGSICLKLSAAGCNDAVGVGCSSPDSCYLGTCSLKSCKVSYCN